MGKPKSERDTGVDEATRTFFFRTSAHPLSAKLYAISRWCFEHQVILNQLSPRNAGRAKNWGHVAMGMEKLAHDTDLLEQNTEGF